MRPEPTRGAVCSDDDALVPPLADRLTLVAGFNAEGDGATLDGGDFGGRRDTQANRRRREVNVARFDARVQRKLPGGS
jgi:hypothetical protein